MIDALASILESKRALRRELAARPVAEKLRILDQLRERDEPLRGSAIATQGAKRGRNGST